MIYALRSLRLHPAFSLIAILTLALGIGATTAIFSVVDHVMLRPLPYAQPDRLVSISTVLFRMEFVASPEYLEWRRSNHVLEQLAAWPHSPRTGYLTVGDEPVKIALTRISDNFFDTLGVHPLLGRGFLPEETRPLGASVIILSHGLWIRSFAGDAGVIGRSVIFEGNPTTIVGVLPPNFQFPEPGHIEALTPLPVPTSTDRRTMAAWNTMGRLKAGVSFGQARAEFERLFENSRHAHPEMYRNDTHLNFVPFQEYRTRNVRLTLMVLLGAAGCVLLIACANVANLLMTRAVARHSELSVRSALGAGAWHLISLPLGESLTLAALGGIAGATLAVGSVNLLRRFGPRSVPGMETVTVDWRVLGFALVASILTGLLCGLIPAVAASRTDLQLGTGRRQAGAGYRPLRRLLVVAEVALSLILLICGGLLMESLYRLQNQNMGFRPESVLTASLSLTGVPLPERLALIERMRELPGVVSLAVSDGLPPGGGGRSTTFSRSDRPKPEAWHRGDEVLVRRVTPDYFPTLGTPLHKGRFFNQRDHAETNGVAIVNEALANRYFAQENVIGKQIDGVGGSHWKTIVGVVGDAKNRGLNQPAQPEMFTPFDMNAGDTDLALAVRGIGDPLALVPLLRGPLHGLPVTFRSLRGNLTEFVAEPRFNAALFGTFAAIALVLAVIGIYGVLSYTVAQRTQEIGIRMALGAWTPDIVKLIVREAMALTLSGVGIGIAGASWAARALTVHLYDVRPNDGVTFATVSGLLILAALLASYLPARRATGIDPAIALRAE
jgi:predicted permease